VESKVTAEGVAPESYHSGIWLFTDRDNITHFFAPNFLPPYDTPDKRKIIMDVVREEWDEKTLSWKPCGQGSMTKNRPQQADNSQGSTVKTTNETNQAQNYLATLDTMIKDVITHAHMAATACTGQFDQTDSTKALENN
jgi:hypothetical protein